MGSRPVSAPARTADHAGALLFVAGKPTPFDTATGGIQAVMPPASKHGLVDVAVTNAAGQSDLLPGA